MSGIILDVHTESRPVEAHWVRFCRHVVEPCTRGFSSSADLKRKKISLDLNALVLLVTSV